MPKISVCLSPMLATLHEFNGKVALVVDILRATTTITTALEYGIKSILPVDSVEQCFDFQRKGYIGAAERGGKIVEGFKLGNSPFDYLNPCYAGKSIVLTTTNGTKTISEVKEAEYIIFGAFVNLNAVAGLLKYLEKDIIIVCAGWEGEVNLEDTIFAGALIELLRPSFSIAGDPARLAHKIFMQSSGDLKSTLENSSHYKRLKELGLQKDIDFCLTLNKFEIIPELVHGEIKPYSVH